MLTNTEKTRLLGVYDGLRNRLLDLTLRNPMLSFKHSPRSKLFLQIVDTDLERLYRTIAIEGEIQRIVGLKEPDTIPKDERSEEFVAALAHARVSDVEYQIELTQLESLGRDDNHALADSERRLRDRVRKKLGLACTRFG